MKVAIAAVIALVVVGCGSTTAPAPAPSSTVVAAPSAAATASPTRAAASPSPTPTPSPSPDVAAFVRHVTGAIDNLAADDSDAVQWFIDEGHWLTDPANSLPLGAAGVSDYIDAVQAGLQAAYDVASEDAAVKAVEALRPQIVAMAPGAVPTVAPTPVPPKAVVVKGTGTRKTKPFTLTAGDFTVVIAGSGRGNVIAELNPRDGSVLDSELLFNEISSGRYRYDTVIYGVAGGSYYLDMTVTGAWVVTFRPL